MNRFFDTHVHFDGMDTASQDAVSSVVARACAAGVKRMLAIGGDEARNTFAVRTAGAHPDHVRAAVGYDRDRAGFVDSVARIESLIHDTPHVAAIGEVGLDFHYAPDKREAQGTLLAQMLTLARRHALPVAVHSREAETETLEHLREHAEAWDGAADRLGVLHCFTGDGRLARQLVDLGYYISFSGIVTFKNAEMVRAAARIVPDDRLLIETDAPYLAPIPHRGTPNEPARVVHVAETLAAVRGTNLETIAALTFRNGCRLFGWRDKEPVVE